MQETWVQSLGWEKRTSLEKRTATHSSTLAWRIPLTGEPGRLSPSGHKNWDTTAWFSLYICLSMHTHTYTHYYTAGNTAKLMMKSGSLRRTKMANSVVQDQMPTGLKPRKSPGFNLTPKAGKNSYSTLNSFDRRSSLLFSLFVLFGPSTNRMRSSHIRE